MKVEEVYDQLPEELQKLSEVQDTHILWKGQLTLKGKYAQVRIGNTVRLAHRVAWDKVWGYLKPGKRLMRTCGEDRCINPQHYKRYS